MSVGHPQPLLKAPSAAVPQVQPGGPVRTVCVGTDPVVSPCPRGDFHASWMQKGLGSGQVRARGENPLRAQKATVLMGVSEPRGLPPAETGWDEATLGAWMTPENSGSWHVCRMAEGLCLHPQPSSTASRGLQGGRRGNLGLLCLFLALLVPSPLPHLIPPCPQNPDGQKCCPE